MLESTYLWDRLYSACRRRESGNLSEAQAADLAEFVHIHANQEESDCGELLQAANDLIRGALNIKYVDAKVDHQQHVAMLRERLGPAPKPKKTHKPVERMVVANGVEAVVDPAPEPATEPTPTNWVSRLWEWIWS